MWDLLKPFFEIALLIPVPLRYSSYILFVLLLARMLPVRALISLVGMIFALLLKSLAHLLDFVSKLYANRGRGSRFLDWIDSTIELLLRLIERVTDWLIPRTRPSWKGIKIPRLISILLVLLPIGLWMFVASQPDTIIGRALTSAFWQTHRTEQRVVTGLWIGSEQPTTIVSTGSSTPVSEGDDLTGDMITATPMPKVQFETYVVRRGDILKDIAGRYNLKTSCLRDINQQYDPKFNPDSLRIGAELLIPLDDPSCTR